MRRCGSVWDFFSDCEAIGPIECLHTGVLKNHGDDLSFHERSEVAKGNRFHGRSVEAKLKGPLATIMKEKPLLCDIVRPHVLKPHTQALSNDFNLLLKLILIRSHGLSI